MEFLDVIYYCNLEHRRDRNSEFLGEMERFGVPSERIHRMKSVYTPHIGALGCSKTHIQVLKHFIASGKATCAVFEDDFMFTVSKETAEATLAQFFNDIGRNFDVLMLGGNIQVSTPTEFSYLKKIIDAQCTSSYVITREFAPVLLELWELAVKRLEVYTYIYGRRNNDDCLDMAWKKLQPGSRWYTVDPVFGIQRPSYSDVENCLVDYRV